MDSRGRSIFRKLGYQPDAIDKQIWRDQIKTLTPTSQGKTRPLSDREVYSIHVGLILRTSGMPAREASELSYLIPYGQDHWDGRRGAPLLLVWRVPDRWSSRWTHTIVNSNGFDFRTWAATKSIGWAVVVDLETESNRVLAAILGASQIEVATTDAPPKSALKASAKRRPGPRS